jgi:hypothetical protein
MLLRGERDSFPRLSKSLAVMGANGPAKTSILKHAASRVRGRALRQRPLAARPDERRPRRGRQVLFCRRPPIRSSTDPRRNGREAPGDARHRGAVSRAKTFADYKAACKQFFADLDAHAEQLRSLLIENFEIIRG